MPDTRMIQKAMIFAAGLGTRFKPWTNHHPKALAVVNGKTLLQRNIEYLQQYGINEVVVNVHHFADQVCDAIEKNNGWGSVVHISNERDALLETGGGLWHARDMLQDAPFLTLNVDFLTTLNLHHFIAFHEQQQSIISLAVAERPSSRCFLFNAHNRLCGWKNMVSGEERIAYPDDNLRALSYSCVAAFQPEVFQHIQHRGKFSIVETYLDIASQHPIYGYNHTGDDMVDVGKPESVALAEALFK